MIIFGAMGLKVLFRSYEGAPGHSALCGCTKALIVLLHAFGEFPVTKSDSIQFPDEHSSVIIKRLPLRKSVYIDFSF